MAIDRISAALYADMLSEGINSRDPTMDTTIGSIRDLRIDPFAEVLETQNNRVVYLSELNSLLNAANLVPDDLDKMVFNEAIVRWDGSSSTTVVSFARAQAPVTDITVPVNFPLATVEDPKTGRVVLFRTIEARTMYAAAAAGYYNADTENYELDVTVASIQSGEETSVGAYSIKVMRRSLSSFDKVYNKQATTSGRALETNREVADRYLLHVQGSQLGSPAGVKSYILDNFSAVEDAYVVYGSNAYLTREQDDAGAVDVWIMGSAPLTRTDTKAYPGVETLMVLDRQPLTSIISVTSGATTFVEGTDYEVVTDTGAYSGSSRGQDGIRFLSGGTVPTNIGDSVTIQYQYNSLMDTLTSFFTQSYYYSMGMDKLFREAQQVDLEIEADLKVASGNPDTIKNTVSLVLRGYINALKLGADTEEFDLDREVAKVKGVNNFTWVQLSIKDGSGVGDITIGPNEYARIAEADLVINPV